MPAAATARVKHYETNKTNIDETKQNFTQHSPTIARLTPVLPAVPAVISAPGCN
jgi:hypothetical protein